MVTESEIKRLLRTLADKDPDLHAAPRTLVVGPVRHIVRLIRFSSHLKTQFNLAINLDPLCDHTYNSAYFFAYYFGLPFAWKTDDKNFPRPHFAQLFGWVIPAMKQVNSLEQTMAAWEVRIPPGLPWRVRFFAQGYVMLGDFGAAGRELRDSRRNMFNSWSPGLGDKLADEQGNFPLASKRALLALMHRREAAKAAELNLDRTLWEPSLFPAEITYPELRVLRPDGTVMDD
ncbi:MAG: hypothetical protein AB7O39_01015 [Flavobacteriaceae bacterium]